MKSPAQHLHTHNTHEEKEKTIFFCVCWTRHAKTQKSNSFIDFFFVFLSFTRWYFGHLCFDRILYGMSCVHVMTVFNLEQKRIELEQWTTPLKTEWKRKKQRTQTPAGSIFISVYMHTHNVCQFVRSEHKLSNFNHWNVLKMGSNGPNIYGSTIAQIVLALHFRLVCDYDLSSFFLLCNFFLASSYLSLQIHFYPFVIFPSMSSYRQSRKRRIFLSGREHTTKRAMFAIWYGILNAYFHASHNKILFYLLFDMGVVIELIHSDLI